MNQQCLHLKCRENTGNRRSASSISQHLSHKKGEADVYSTGEVQRGEICFHVESFLSDLQPSSVHFIGFVFWSLRRVRLYFRGNKLCYLQQKSTNNRNKHIMSLSASSSGACATPGCEKVVAQRLACPKCMQLGIPPAYFCGQECFTKNYAQHKKVHTLYKQILAAQT